MSTMSKGNDHRGSQKTSSNKIQAGIQSKNRFTNPEGPSFEWIFIKGDPSRYASFNRNGLWKCESAEDFRRLCREIRQCYINENGPLASVNDIEYIRSFFDKALGENDPTQIVRAYTADTGFYSRLNTDLSQLPTHWSKNRYERNMVSILMFHPVFRRYSFMGISYRGMTMYTKDLNEYVPGSIFMNKTFLSTSKDPSKAEAFGQSNKSSTNHSVICKYLTKNSRTALAIEEISEYPEEEVLILPYATFKVKSIQKIDDITSIYVEELEEGEGTTSQNWDLASDTDQWQKGNDGEETCTVFEASYAQSYSTSEIFVSNQPMDMKTLLSRYKKW